MRCGFNSLATEPSAGSHYSIACRYFYSSLGLSVEADILMRSFVSVAEIYRLSSGCIRLYTENNVVEVPSGPKGEYHMMVLSLGRTGRADEDDSVVG